MSYLYIFLFLTLHLPQALPGPSFLKPRFLSDTTYITVTEGFWGEWFEPMEVPSGNLACGLGLRIEPPQGTGEDDTSANAVKIIYCQIEDWNNDNELELNEGIWGDWQSEMCPEGSFINGVIARLEAKQGDDNDDTALNSLMFKCKDILTGSVTSDITLQSTDWGDWLDWVEYDNSYICGGQVRFEPEQGYFGDDTALNGVKFKFCDYTT